MVEEEVSGDGYIQGAGDDSEGWAQGLTAGMFWAHRDELMQAVEDNVGEERMEKLVRSIVMENDRRDTNGTGADSQESPNERQSPFLVAGTRGLYIGKLNDLSTIDVKFFDTIITCSESPDDRLMEKLKARYLHLRCTHGKLGSRDLRKELSRLHDYIESMSSLRNLLVCCPTGEDLSVGVALAVSCLYLDDDGELPALIWLYPVASGVLIGAQVNCSRVSGRIPPTKTSSNED